MVRVENYEAHNKKWADSFDNPEMSDVVFQARDGRTFHCQTFVLEVASSHFKRLFSSSGSHGSSSKFVTAEDVEPNALKWVLRACYTGDGDLDDDNVVGVMLAAQHYGMDWVEKACMSFLRKDRAGPVVTFEYSRSREKWVEWKVPKSGWYHIVAMGAKAVDAPVDSYLFQAKGGEGAIVGASFELHANDVLQILTGGMSRIYSKSKAPNYYGGGGGGTFVALKRHVPFLLIAAGGGGGVNSKYYGCDASLSDNGIASNASYLGGKAGSNGASYSVYTGGLGWKAGAAALAKPSTTGVNDIGGFGGGGDLIGGGGGYSGGGTGYGAGGGGGGGSHVAYEASTPWKKVGNSSHGKVYIWNGKEIPAEEKFFLQQIGSTDHKESTEAWELIT